MKTESVEHELRRMDAIVGAAHRKFTKGATVSLGGEGVDWSNPLDELIAREEQAIEEAQIRALRVLCVEGVELPPEVMERIRQEVFDEFRQYEDGLMEWIFAAGPHPLDVLRRLFAYTKMKRASLLWNMGFRKIGPLLKETHAAAQLRCRALFGSISTGWSKPAEAVKRMRVAQRGNFNRLGGRKVAGFTSVKNQ